jgi:hypothetical protein
MRNAQALAQLEKRVSEMVKLVKALQAKVGEGAPKDDSDNSVDLDTSQDVATYMATIEAAYYDEPVDVEWSTEAVGAIEGGLAAETLSGSSLVSAECRSSICIAVIDHLDDESMTKFELEFPLAVSQHLSSFVMKREELSDGGTRATVYMARQGFDLAH